MLRIDVCHLLAGPERDAVYALVAEVQRRTAHRPLSDHLWLDLVHGGRSWHAAVLCRDDDGSLLAYCQLSEGTGSWAIELVLDPDRADDPRGPEIARLTLAAARDTIATAGGGHVHWWVFDPSDDIDALAAGIGLGRGRTLFQMRVPLPLAGPEGPVTTDVETRPFEVGLDERAWLEVNNAAFAWHAEQGNWDLATLELREREDWFDPTGFLIHERDGRLAAFCWTKLHHDADPVLGEIYVIAVHPDFHGLGLGKALTVAGLSSIASRGVTTGMLYVDSDNVAAVGLYRALGFSIHRTDRAYVGDVGDVAGATDPGSPRDALPTWSVADVHESFTARSFTDALERMASDVDRLVAQFDDTGIRGIEPRPPTAADADVTARAIVAYNHTARELAELRAYTYATVATDTRHEQAQALLSEIETRDAEVTPLLARLADWVASLGAGELAALHPTVAEHVGPLRRLADRSTHQMSEAEEHLYAELATTGSSAWSRLHRETTSQLTAEVRLPDGPTTLPINAVRGLATHADPAVRRAAYDAELEAWPRVATVCAAAMNAIKGEANVVDRRRQWASPLDASLFANSVSRPTYDAMNAAISASLPRLRGWLRSKSRLHGHDRPLPWIDLFAPLPVAPGGITWTQGVSLVRDAFAGYSRALASLVDRAIAERWIDAEPRDGKVGGAFCMSFVDDRSLVLLNWSGSVAAAQTTAHELGHAYHNTQLAHRTALQRRLPMALAETASIFCETLVVEAGLRHLQGAERLALLDVDLQGSTQVVVDIRSRVLFETEVFTRRQRRTLGANELHEMMREAQSDAYGDGLDQSTAHPYMWILKPHYYGSNFYNWPYTYGLLFGLGLFARYQADPERFQAGYDDLLSRAGMDTAEELGAAFGIDVTDEAFWTASLDVIGDRIHQYDALVAELGLAP